VENEAERFSDEPKPTDEVKHAEFVISCHVGVETYHLANCCKLSPFKT